MSYQQLPDQLAAIGAQDSPANIANKMSRGSFTAVFMVQCLVAIGCKRIEIVTE